MTADPTHDGAHDSTDPAEPPILVTGGTGTLGRQVVPMLLAAGHTVRVAARHPMAEPPAGVQSVVADLVNGTGVAEALAGSRVVLHLAGGRTGDVTAAENLERAAQPAGVEHLILISVVAADRLPVRYYRDKTAAEHVIEGSPVGWTILRAAQFHDLVLMAARALAHSPVLPIPSAVRLQPVDTRDVAARLVELAGGPPAGRVRDLVGPRTYRLPDLVRGYLAARHQHRLVVPLPLPRRFGRPYAVGANLGGPDADQGTRTWEDFLAERLG